MAAMVQILRTFALVASLVVPVAGGAHAQPASANETARLLAGMQPSPDSPLLALTKEQAWQQYAKRFDAIFANIESRQLTRIRAWSQAKLTSPSPVLFYMFSGPDFLYANAFFPNASTYVMSGLEPIGSVPDLTKLSRDSLAHGLSNIEESLNSILRYSFFQTIEMRRTLVAGRVTGTLPILYVFLARSGKTIRDVSLVGVGEDGTARVDDGADREAATGGNGARGVKIEFVGDDGRPQTLYYFSINVDNDGFRVSGFAGFCERLGTGDAFVKSASYLMYRDHFSDVRNFLLEHSRLLLQDDSGIPVARFVQASWQLRPFGHYSGPIDLFANRYQSKLAQLFNQGHVESINFGVGYRWRPQSSNLMVAAKTEVATPGSVADKQPGPASRTVPSNAEPLSHKNRGVFGTDVDTHKTADRVRLHHGSKYASLARSARTGARTHMLQAHPLYLQAYPMYAAPWTWH
jgi:hypothetical protein